jgi:hypothetical protein
MRKISCFIDRVKRETRVIKRKPSMIVAIIYLLVGIFVWIFGSRTRYMYFVFIYPRSALPIGVMFISWGISFLFSGFVLAQILMNCEKYKRHIAQKCSFLLVFMQLFCLISYILFFGAFAPFFSF